MLIISHNHSKKRKKLCDPNEVVKYYLSKAFECPGLPGSPALFLSFQDDY